MTEVETLRFRARKYINEGNKSEILDLRDALFGIVLECDKALEVLVVRNE